MSFRREKQWEKWPENPGKEGFRSHRSMEAKISLVLERVSLHLETEGPSSDRQFRIQLVFPSPHNPPPDTCKPHTMKHSTTRLVSLEHSSRAHSQNLRWESCSSSHSSCLRSAIVANRKPESAARCPHTCMQPASHDSPQPCRYPGIMPSKLTALEKSLSTHAG
jgi:hypothetical protein